tara:strand:- start:35 stop:751 length:717 start_codon:yes stop_codon:yes gene_type:complete
MLKDSYIISYRSATCGSFFSALIYSWLKDHDFSTHIFPKSGHAHYFEKIVATSRNPNINAIHQSLDFDLLNSNIQTCQHFHIHHTVNDLEVIAAFRLMKLSSLFVQSKLDFLGDFTDPLIKTAWSKVYSISDPTLKIKTCIDIIKDVYLGDIKDGLNPYGENEFVKNDYFVPCPNEKTLNIAFSELINNPESILRDLTECLQVDMPAHIPVFYQNYLTANKLLLEKHCPWLTYCMSNT